MPNSWLSLQRREPQMASWMSKVFYESPANWWTNSADLINKPKSCLWFGVRLVDGADLAIFFRCVSDVFPMWGTSGPLKLPLFEVPIRNFPMPFRCLLDDIIYIYRYAGSISIISNGKTSERHRKGIGKASERHRKLIQDIYIYCVLFGTFGISKYTKVSPFRLKLYCDPNPILVRVSLKASKNWFKVV